MKYRTQNITLVQGPAIIAHGVNTQNAMGSGVAKALYTRWPKVKAEYHRHTPQHLGDVQYVQVEPDIVVVNCFTQRNYGRDGRRYADADAVLETLTEVAYHAVDTLDLDKVHIPKIGCGLGGLSWEDEIAPRLEDMEEELSVTFVVCYQD